MKRIEIVVALIAANMMSPDGVNYTHEEYLIEAAGKLADAIIADDKLHSVATSKELLGG